MNPYGGKRKALKIFEKYGKPLFKIAGVDVSVIVSQRQNQIRDIVIHHNLDMFDSIACVGGDGTVSELVNGLVLRECKKSDIDPDDSNQTLPKPSFPIGIIPGLSYYLISRGQGQEKHFQFLGIWYSIYYFYN